ncbi:MAG TPA: M23 family metallopeptidase [Longimicrobiales bacterium]|nr:M23 family metallopeptidase [Longimicrobiales bacterium]
MLAGGPVGAAMAWPASLRPAPADAAPARATHELFTDSLRYAAEPAVFAAWAESGRLAVSNAPTIRPPYAEAGVLGDSGGALGYRIDLRAGERLVVEFSPDSAAAPFLDLYVTPGDSTARPFLSRSGPVRLEYLARTDGHVLIRLQARPGESTAYAIAVDRTAALTFPVLHDDASVIGHFLEARDGGARRHRGIDIHAPRGTPVLAAADGVVERVTENELGGLVVWIRETASNRKHYYAHLDAQHVRAGAVVRAGDIVGTVGNTGNAADTPPHLHFGIYRRGIAVNPMLYLDAPAGSGDEQVAREQADPGLAGTRARTRVAGAAFRVSNLGDSRPRATLPARAELEIVAAAGRFYRVRDAGGAEGFVAAWLLDATPPVEPRRRPARAARS